MLTYTLRADYARPLVTCIAEPERPPAPNDAWLESAHTDYLWMAAEFNRQYINSHGKTHADYTAEAADDELQMHYLNGRLWCFFGAVSNATRSLREVVRRRRDHIFAHLLLAKIFIGQGLPQLAVQALDEAARIQPEHWQTHLLRLFVLRRLGRLHERLAADSHHVVCTRLSEACAQAGMPSLTKLLCEGGRVQLGPLENEAAGSGKMDGGQRTGGGASDAFLGAHLVTERGRKKLHADRYVELRRLLPRRLLKLLQAWYSRLRKTPSETAAFQEKTRRHEYFPEILSTFLNLALEPLASAISQTTVAPTYPFPITYIPGGGIHPHLDVSDNELSLTFQVQLEGELPQWPLVFLDPRGQELSNLNASKAKQVVLKDNDGVLYYGPDIVHWREKQLSTLTQIVFAFREEDVTHCNNQ